MVVDAPILRTVLSRLPHHEVTEGTDTEATESTDTEMRAWAREVGMSYRDLYRTEEVFVALGLVETARKRIDGRRRKVWRFGPKCRSAYT